jgi:hypothetical protein
MWFRGSGIGGILQKGPLISGAREKKHRRWRKQIKNGLLSAGASFAATIVAATAHFGFRIADRL